MTLGDGQLGPRNQGTKGPKDQGTKGEEGTVVFQPLRRLGKAPVLGRGISFGATIKVSELEEEPSPSRTRLSLSRGEVVVGVPKLKPAHGSSFTVATPMGAVGVRGTVFRIVFRPTGTGNALFSPATVRQITSVVAGMTR